MLKKNVGDKKVVNTISIHLCGFGLIRLICLRVDILS